MTLRFGCTQCGKCCHDLRLTLSVAEAIDWAERGNHIELLAEAIPWPDDVSPADSHAVYQRERSFAAVSGEVTFRIAPRVVAYHKGACPHLGADLRCTAYERRPRICRIYPLESRPFAAVDPSARRCPPEAWGGAHDLLIEEETIADPLAAGIVAGHRREALADIAVLQAACRILGFAEAAFAGEGLMRFCAPSRQIAAALSKVEPITGDPIQEWTIVTNRASTFALLRDAGCRPRLSIDDAGYLNSFAAAA